MSHNLSMKHKAFAFLLIASMLFGSLMITAPKAQAASSYDEMVLMIKSLLEQITTLQAKLETMRSNEGGFTNQFAVGDEVVTTGSLKVRREAMIAENVLSILPASARGSIVEGPKTSGGYTWWKVSYTNGVTGWSAANWLKEVAPVSTGDTKDTAIYGEIFTITSGENPTIKGKASGVSEVGFSISNGDKVYGSGPIPVVGGVWSHKVTTDLAYGKYTVYLYINNKEVDQRSFEVGETTTVPLSVKVVSPTSGSYNYGDTLTVKWEQIGEAPKGSKACVSLRNTTTYKEFAFPPENVCVDVAGAEPERSISGVLVRTSGYDLTPGNYRAKVRIIGPSSPDGKDGGVLAVGKDAGTFLIKEDLSIEYKIDITSPTDYTSVNPGDTVTLKWNQTNLSGYQGHVEFTGDGAPQRHLNTGFDLSTGMVDVKIPVSDSFGVVAPGAYLLKLRTINIKDGSSQDVGDSVKIDIGEAKQNFKAIAGGVLLEKIYSVTKAVAEEICREVYNDPNEYDKNGGVPLKCYWGGVEFSIDEMKG